MYFFWTQKQMKSSFRKFKYWISLFLKESIFASELFIYWFICLQFKSIFLFLSSLFMHNKWYNMVNMTTWYMVCIPPSISTSISYFNPLNIYFLLFIMCVVPLNSSGDIELVSPWLFFSHNVQRYFLVYDVIWQYISIFGDIRRYDNIWR